MNGDSERENLFFYLSTVKQKQKRKEFYKRFLYNGSVIFLFQTVNGLV